MEEQLNISNLTLDDNSFVLLPEGDYRFYVESHDVGYSSSDKLPQNTQQITCHLVIPYKEDGAIRYAKIRHNLNVYKKAFFAIRQFTDCIGLTQEKGRASIDLNNMDGKCGVCHITTRESNNGNEYNNVQTLYAPSKAPAVTDNDEAWKYREFATAEESLDDIRALFDKA